MLGALLFGVKLLKSKKNILLCQNKHETFFSLFIHLSFIHFFPMLVHTFYLLISVKETYMYHGKIIHQEKEVKDSGKE